MSTTLEDARMPSLRDKQIEQAEAITEALVKVETKKKAKTLKAKKK